MSSRGQPISNSVSTVFDDEFPLALDPVCGTCGAHSQPEDRPPDVWEQVRDPGHPADGDDWVCQQDRQHIQAERADAGVVEVRTERV